MAVDGLTRLSGQPLTLGVMSSQSAYILDVGSLWLLRNNRYRGVMLLFTQKSKACKTVPVGSHYEERHRSSGAWLKGRDKVIETLCRVLNEYICSPFVAISVSAVTGSNVSVWLTCKNPPSCLSV